MGNTNDRNAGSVVAGFVYQIYYFLYRLLTMGVDGTVSLEKFEEMLIKGGLNATTRRTLGADINAACGQLRREYEI